MDINNKVIGFGGRVMGDGKPKYLNSPETKLFDKSKNLYGLNVARSSRKNNLINMVKAIWMLYLCIRQALIRR